MSDRVERDYDVIIIGGGPAGATAALVLARQGVRVVVIEKAAFPRFQIGESLLPVGYNLIVELGLADRLAKVPHIEKLGAEFAMGDASAMRRFRFDMGLIPCSGRTVNVLRSAFDAMLLDAAVEAGATLLQPMSVSAIQRLADDDVVVVAGDQRLSARMLLDCSGHATVVGRHLGTRRIREESHLRKVAYFQHFEGVERLPGDMAGFPTIVMCEEGWFWIIPLDERLTSVGLVLDPAVAKQVDRPATRMLQWSIERSPMMLGRLAGAQGPEENMVRSDFSYRCWPYAGPGYFLVGDAATFLDPVFSTGVCLGMKAAVEAAGRTAAILGGQERANAARRRYLRYVQRGTAPLFRMIRHYYRHEFRELFLEGQGPMQVHRAVLSLLAGYVFPRPPWSVRWRFRLFELVAAVQRHRALAPRRKRFSLLASSPQAWSPVQLQREGQCVGGAAA